MSQEIIESADDEYSSREGEEYSFEEFLEHVEDNPQSVVNSVQYLVNAIEYFGTRDVIEYGEEVERYRFFDDPTNNGEHAVLGNSEELNSFVESLKRKASPDGENDKIFWFTGPTATGKSELKRCLLNGLQAYAETDEGQRFTVEWSLDSLTNDGLTYGSSGGNNRKWYRSPVHANPLLVLPEETRDEYVEQLGQDINISGELDPFSRVAFNHLSEQYDTFSEMVSEDHLRIVSYQPEIGEGFGVLQSEDTGAVKEKLVGSWMREAMEEYSERGRKNAQAFTYDGVLSQGNSSVSLVEDAQHHNKLFSKLMNVCEEDIVKLDNKITMHIDTVIMCISNPDFGAAISEYQQADEEDPHKALRRRLEKYQMRYLTSVVLETQLLIKELTKENILWEETDVDDLYDKAAQSIEKFDTHFSPHAVEVAAYYDVISRLDEESTLGVAARAEYYDKGYYIKNGERREPNGKIIDGRDGLTGLPSTYTQQVLSELAQKEEYVMPYDVIDGITENLDAPVFSEKDVSHIDSLSMDVMQYAFDRMEEDVLEAIVSGDYVTRDQIDGYVDSLFSWEEGDEEGYDSFKVKEFEKEYLDRSEGDYHPDNTPKPTLAKFRKDKVIKPINSYIYNNKEDFDDGDIPIDECEVFDFLLDDDSWRRVSDLYPNLDFNMWSEPPENSETEEVKEQTIENLISMGYNEQSAEEASLRVINEKV